MNSHELVLNILVDNYAGKTQLAEWGWAVHISWKNKEFLFDTGRTGDVLLSNAKELGVGLGGLEGIILSHGHYDHADGIKHVLEESGCQKIYGHPEIFSNKYSVHKNGKKFSGMKIQRRELEENLGVDLKLHEGIFEIHDGMFMTGEVPFEDFDIPAEFQIKTQNGFVQDTFMDDNSLVFRTSKGLVILLGCAHRGVMNIVEYARSKFNEPVRAVVGGMHLFDADEVKIGKIINYFKKLDLEIIAPGHCTGMGPTMKLKESFPNKCLPAFSGAKFEFVGH
ncbi:MAG: MBL fold metallo-hydrolase [Bacteriovoracaceae bacterium]|nr:MBL fold metallo-hydrolase [Bacteriovoracaceae bacterium]